MGVIRRQSLKRTTIAYVGVVIGAISNLFVYPLSFEIYGLAQFIISCAQLIRPFASFGMSRVVVKFFPVFRQENNKHRGLLGFAFLTIVFGFTTLFLLLTFFEAHFVDLFEMLQMNSDVFLDDKVIICLVSFFIVASTILSHFSSNFKRIVIPEIFDNLFFKVTLPILVYAFYLSIIDQTAFKQLLVLTYILAMSGLFWYVHSLGQLSLRIDWTFLDLSLTRKMLNYGLYVALSIVGYFLTFRIDTVMITSFIGYKSAGFYSLFSYMVNLMVIPYMAIMAISGPLIAEQLHRKSTNLIVTIYKNSSEILFFSSLVIVGSLWLSMDQILNLTGEGEVLRPLKITFLILAIGQLFNVTTGMNDPIIGYSKYYRFNLYAMLFLSAINILMNIYLIPSMGIAGAALATAISLVIYNLAKLIFIYIKFRIVPFSLVHIKIGGIAALCFAVSFILPKTSIDLATILIKSGLFAISLILLTLLFHLSKEIDNLAKDILKSLKMNFLIDLLRLK
ncbi:MAG: polysaccharide biosynthesis C-terminal domain-containing protein [Saprospiraceae bacterium]|nr:polysaccharide biosynthesis C-terminal domain-containing protein [Saprospiraceae bacterium]